MVDFQLPFSSLALWLLALSIVTTTWLTVSRLFFSPIANFPGPKLAAASWWYEFYYDVVLGGQYGFKLRELHDKYGPVIRINPEELHFSDPDFYDTIFSSFASGQKRDKWERAFEYLGLQGSALSTRSHDLHRPRRAAFGPFFSSTNVRNLQPVIDGIVSSMLGRIKDYQDSGEPLAVDVAMPAYANDVVMQYCFGYNLDKTNMPGFDPAGYDSWVGGLKIGHVLKNNIWMFHALQSLPERVSGFIAPAYGDFIAEKNDVGLKAKKILETPRKSSSDVGHRTIFHEILDSKLPDQEKDLDRLSKEAMLLIVAGTLTTAWTLAIAMYNIIVDPLVCTKLRTELQSAIPDPSVPPALVVLEQLPYLKGVVQESLRLAYGVTGRSERIPHEAMEYTNKATSQTWLIPAGTPCSSMTLILHHDESTFPDSRTFRPERWIEDPRLDKHLVSFSKGTRQCLGMSLAYAEMYLMLAAIFRNYGTAGCRMVGDKGVLQLFDTDIRDVLAVSDYGVPVVWKGSKGVRIKILPAV